MNAITINDEWLINYHSPIIRIRSLDSLEVCFSGPISETIAQILFPGDVSTRKLPIVEVHHTEKSADLSITDVLDNGLELKPHKVNLARDESFSIKSEMQELVSDYRAMQHRTSVADAELKMTQKVISDMVVDKEKYEKSVLKRVSEILNERNKWIKKFQSIKTEEDPAY